MPQLDLMHFFTQFFWFSIGFTFLYAYLLHNVIPTIAKNLKFRQKKLEVLANDINKGKDGASDLLGVYDQLKLYIYHPHIQNRHLNMKYELRHQIYFLNI